MFFYGIYWLNIVGYIWQNYGICCSIGYIKQKLRDVLCKIMGYIGQTLRDIFGKTMGYIGLRLVVILLDRFGKHYGKYWVKIMEILWDILV